jgi:hypothetical protein
VLTPPFETACGVTNLEIGREYLLAGRTQGSKLRINECNAIPEKDPGYGNPPGALHWKLVDALLLEQLEHGFVEE